MLKSVAVRATVLKYMHLGPHSLSLSLALSNRTFTMTTTKQQELTLKSDTQEDVDKVDEVCEGLPLFWDLW